MLEPLRFGWMDTTSALLRLDIKAMQALNSGSLKTGFWASHGLMITSDDLVVWFSNVRMLMADLHWG